MQNLQEFDVIERYFARNKQADDVLLGIGDDAAVLDTHGPIAVTVDTLNVGIHFPEDFPAHALGHRVLAVNLSDLAAMGAKPRWCTLALTLPEISSAWLENFSAGFFALAERHGVSLVGGNLSRGPLSATLQLLGSVEAGAFLKRGGGQVGDDVYITGTPGDAAAGLAELQAQGPTTNHARALIERFCYPSARVAAGLALVPHANAAIDISDGLLADLGHLTARSACAAVVDANALPLSAALLAQCDLETALAHALRGGDDYELCFSAAPERAGVIAAAMQTADTQVTRIGQLVSGSGVRVLRAGAPFEAGGVGFRHF
jgi:thiamine-monophosphate kinase